MHSARKPMDDLTELYQDIILSHSRRPKNEGKLEPCDYESEGFNPLCGDRVNVYARVDDEKHLSKVQFVGDGCAISRASASIMTSRLTGLSLEAVHQKIGELVSMLTAPDEPQGALERWGELAALAGVRRFPARIKCATLAWHTLEAALKGREKNEV